MIGPRPLTLVLALLQSAGPGLPDLALRGHSPQGYQAVRSALAGMARAMAGPGTTLAPWQGSLEQVVRQAGQRDTERRVVPRRARRAYRRRARRGSGGGATGMVR